MPNSFAPEIDVHLSELPVTSWTVQLSETLELGLQATDDERVHCHIREHSHGGDDPKILYSASRLRDFYSKDQIRREIANQIRHRSRTHRSQNAKALVYHTLESFANMTESSDQVFRSPEAQRVLDATSSVTPADNNGLRVTLVLNDHQSTKTFDEVTLNGNRPRPLRVWAVKEFISMVRLSPQGWVDVTSEWRRMATEES